MSPTGCPAPAEALREAGALLVLLAACSGAPVVGVAASAIAMLLGAIG